MNEESAKLEQGFRQMEKTSYEKYSQVNEREMIVMRTNNETEQANVKYSLLQMKLKDLQKKLGEERAKHDDILKAFSPGINKAKDDNQIINQRAIESNLTDCHKELNDFYSRLENETDSEAAQNHISQSMTHILDPIPRLVLWRALISSQEQVIIDLKTLIKDMTSRQAGLGPKTKREAIEATLDYAITFINGKELLAKLKIKKVLIPKVDALTSGIDEVLGSFASVIDDNLGTNTTHFDNQQQIIEQFVLTIAKHLVLDAELKFVDKISDNIREEHTKLQEQINHQDTKMMTEDTHRLYEQLETGVRELEGEVTKMYQLKNKLESERKYNEDFVRNKFKLNTSVMGGSGNATVTFNAVANHMNLPSQYCTELELFEQLPIDTLKYVSPAFQK